MKKLFVFMSILAILTLIGCSKTDEPQNETKSTITPEPSTGNTESTDQAKEPESNETTVGSETTEQTPEPTLDSDIEGMNTEAEEASEKATEVNSGEIYDAIAACHSDVWVTENREESSLNVHIKMNGGTVKKNISQFYGIMKKMRNNCGFEKEYDSVSFALMVDDDYIFTEILNEYKGPKNFVVNPIHLVLNESYEKAVDKYYKASDIYKVYLSKEFKIVSSKKLANNPDKFKDRKIGVKGKVFQVASETVLLTYGKKNNNILYAMVFDVNDSIKLKEGDKVTVYGSCIGKATYTTTLGTTNTVAGMLITEAVKSK